MNMAYGGHPGESLRLRALAAENGLFLLEDAAHALGTRTAGGHVGTLGVAGAYSFFSNKNLPIGEGGMIVCADDSLSDRLRLLRSHGITALIVGPPSRSRLGLRRRRARVQLPDRRASLRAGAESAATSRR